MRFSQSRAENHVEIAAGAECSTLSHGIRQSLREHHSDSHIHKEKHPLGKII